MDAITNLVVIGASTGGTRVLPKMLLRLPVLRAAVVIVQHMPEFITASFVKTLGRHSVMPLKVAVDGDELRDGHVWVVPGGVHGVLSANRQMHLDGGPKVNFVRPSVDATMLSIKPNVRLPGLVGVILTGMGRDGAAGLAHLKGLGALTIAQSQETCAVFGMPKEAIATGNVDQVLAPDEIADLLIERAGRG